MLVYFVKTNILEVGLDWNIFYNLLNAKHSKIKNSSSEQNSSSKNHWEELFLVLLVENFGTACILNAFRTVPNTAKTARIGVSSFVLAMWISLECVILWIVFPSNHSDLFSQ